MNQKCLIELKFKSTIKNICPFEQIFLPAMFIWYIVLIFNVNICPFIQIFCWKGNDHLHLLCNCLIYSSANRRIHILLSNLEVKEAMPQIKLKQNSPNFDCQKERKNITKMIRIL